MKKDKKIIIAVPRGRILSELKFFLKKMNLIPEDSLFDNNCRKLNFSSNNESIKFVKVRAFDVCTFVAFGAAQLGVAGSDIIEEFDNSEVYSPVNLNIGKCRLSVAALETLIKKEDPKTCFFLLHIYKSFFFARTTHARVHLLIFSEMDSGRAGQNPARQGRAGDFRRPARAGPGWKKIRPGPSLKQRFGALKICHFYIFLSDFH